MASDSTNVLCLDVILLNYFVHVHVSLVMLAMIVKSVCENEIG